MTPLTSVFESIFSFVMQNLQFQGFVKKKNWDLSSFNFRIWFQIINQKLLWFCCQSGKINDNSMKKAKNRKYAWEQGSPSISKYVPILCDWIKILNILLAYTIMQNFGKKTINKWCEILCHVIYCWNSQILKEL